MRNFHNKRGDFRPKRYSNFRNKARRFAPKASTISIDKLIAKAVDSEPTNIYVDERQCSQFEVHDIIKRNMCDKGYTSPTKIQFKAIPEILNGRDLLGIANTGSGKTATFLVPMIDKIMKDRSGTCLIVVPTRELAMQIQDEFKHLAKDTGLKSVLIMGGNSMRAQVSVLDRNPNFIIATPGRLKDLAERRVLNLAKVNYVILDEVDRMLDMGFIDDIKHIVAKLNPNRQSLFFSATLNHKAEEIANKLLHNPLKIEVESEAQGKNVDQDVVRVKHGENKIDVLVTLLRKTEVEKVLVFTSTKRQADRLCKELRHSQIFVEALHGDKRQNQRTKIIDSFKKGQCDVLIATDVASRGLDVERISHVINYDMPQSYSDYVHRIGRTGRAGRKGFALTFI